VPSLALGSGLVTPLDLTAAYTIFPGGGEVVLPRGILSVADANGSGVYASSIDKHVVLDDAVSRIGLAQMRTAPAWPCRSGRIS
jgi:penicillin-binding protein 1A